ncbi:hypothetical protein MMC11_008340 [Xylographa trunciseda]|nr:hypothetical protein [Xylographa trunciseda]
MASTDPSMIPAAVLAGPAVPPPVGVKPNLTNPDSTGHILIIVSSILLGIMLSFVLNRLYVKIFMTRKFGWDDASCVVATLFTIAYFTVGVIGVTQCHVGVHLWNVTLGDFLSNTNIIDVYLSEILASPGFMFIKITFFLLYLQLFRPVRSLRIAIYIGLVFTLLAYTSFTIAWFALGTPSTHETWQQHFLGPEQTKGNGLDWPIPAIGLAGDIYILVIPLVGIYGLQLPMRRKIGVAMVFLTGVLAIIASILRIVYTVAVSSNTLSDLTYNLMPVQLTIIVEMTLGVTVSCMPAFSHMLHQHVSSLSVLRSRLTSLFSKTARSTKGSSTGWSSKHTAPSASEQAGFVRVHDGDMSVSDYEMARYKAPRTYISSGKSGRTEEDGVHLKYEVKQETHDLRDPQRSPVMELF